MHRPSSEEDGAGMRSVNLDVTGRAVTILQVLVMLRAARLLRTNAMILAMALKAELRNGAPLQHPWVA